MLPFLPFTAAAVAVADVDIAVAAAAAVHKYLTSATPQ